MTTAWIPLGADLVRERLGEAISGKSCRAATAIGRACTELPGRPLTVNLDPWAARRPPTS